MEYKGANKTKYKYHIFICLEVFNSINYRKIQTYLNNFFCLTDNINNIGE